MLTNCIRAALCILLVSAAAATAQPPEKKPERIRKDPEMKISMTLPEDFQWDRIEWSPAPAEPHGGFAVKRLVRLPSGDGYWVWFGVRARRIAGTLAEAWPQFRKSLSDQFETKSLNETRDTTFKGEKAVEVRMAGISVEGKHERSSRCLLLKRKGILYIIQFEIPRGREAEHARDLKACEKAVALTG